MPSDQIWEGEAEHHFTIVAFDHMALKLWPTPVAIPSIVEQEVAEVRDLVTHWQDNMPVFNTRQRKQEPPRRSGNADAARNPEQTPTHGSHGTPGAGRCSPRTCPPRMPARRSA